MISVEVFVHISLNHYNFSREFTIKYKLLGSVIVKL